MSSVDSFKFNTNLHMTLSFYFIQKADKTTLDNLVSRSKFDSSFGQLDEALKELLEKLSANVSLR